MKSIKYFQYKNTYNFKKFLNAYGYILNDVKGFSFVEIKQYHGNILKTYFIHFNDGEKEYFKVVYFKSWNECNQARLSFSCIKLSGWYSSAYVRWYKVKDVWGVKDYYVIEC